MQLTHLKRQLRRGDKATIAKITNSSLDMVIKVLNGQRSANGEKGKRIVRTAKAIVRQRQKLEELYNDS